MVYCEIPSVTSLYLKNNNGISFAHRESHQDTISKF